MAKRSSRTTAFGKWFAARLEQSGTKQEALARKIGVEPATVSAWKPPTKVGMRGYVTPGFESVLKVAEFFGESPSKLFGMLGETGEKYARLWEEMSLPSGKSAAQRWREGRHEEAHAKLEAILDDGGSAATAVLAVLDALSSVRLAKGGEPDRTAKEAPPN